VVSKKSVLYALSFDEQGQLQLGVDAAGEPVRGGGTGFEQDILIFERVQGGVTSIIPRVIAEVKFGRVTTHDALTYAEKARRIRIIYPFVRYGLILGQMSGIPGRVLRLGQEFDLSQSSALQRHRPKLRRSDTSSCRSCKHRVI
jgi:hypothetical protein